MLLKGMMSMEVKGKSGEAPAASPLLFSQSSDSYGVFHISPTHLCEITKRGYILSVLGQEDSIESKIALK
jgi:hypothetical protein